jgi:hypothetical protein
VAGFRDGERTVDRSTTMSHRGSGNRESGGCVLVDIANREIPMESMVKAYGSGHLDQGLVKGLARKEHRGSENRESRGHKHCVIVNVETPMEGLATVTRRQVIWIVF